MVDLVIAKRKQIDPLSASERSETPPGGAGVYADHTIGAACVIQATRHFYELFSDCGPDKIEKTL